MKQGQLFRTLLLLLLAATQQCVIASPSSNIFNILWHIGPQIEEISDLAPENKSKAQELSKLTDGYYFLFVNDSHLQYWPNRPQDCSTNFRSLKYSKSHPANNTASSDLESSLKLCNQLFREFASQESLQHQSSYEDVYIQAIKRAINNSAGAQNKHNTKPKIVTELLYSEKLFSKKADGDLILSRSPVSLTAMSELELSPTDIMIYKEPKIDGSKSRDIDLCNELSCDSTLSSLELLDLKKALLNQAQKKTTALNENTRVIINLRSWNKNKKSQIELDSKNHHAIDGVLFEGSAEPKSKPFQPTNSQQSIARGLLWILKNTELNVYLLVPSTIKNPSANSTPAENIKHYLLFINRYLNENLDSPQKNAICTRRITLVPAGYGSPNHIKQFSTTETKQSASPSLYSIIKATEATRRELCR